MPFPTAAYCGRFAPSPTGPLHIGSLTCALASFLDARAAGGRWLVRIEDLDPPREKPGAAAAILQALDAHGLHWDGDVVFQSQRLAAYETALTQLIAGEQVFACALSRVQLEAFGNNHPGRSISRAQTGGSEEHAWRLDVHDEAVQFNDRIQGPQSFNVAQTGGAFVVRRRDGLFAYQLAVVVDDAAQGITDIVRGADLLDSTPRQILLQRALALPTPRYAHIPVLLDAGGEKLSKQDNAAPVTAASAMPNLRRALRALGQPDHPQAADIPELLAAAIACWQIDRVPQQPGIPLAAQG